MSKEKTFAEQILQFNEILACVSLDLPSGYKIINPFAGDQKDQVKRVTTAFYRKYYNDTCPRRLILGSSPARRGTAITGVPFEDAKHLQSETGIFIDKFYINKYSTGFLFDVIREYGGCEKFYSDFYMNFVCPLGIVRTNTKGNEVNCNYYESKNLEKVLYQFIISTLCDQVNFGIDTTRCYCIGSGENYRFLAKLNKKYNLFTEVIPLEHPRFIMQYNSKRKDEFLQKYLSVLRIPAK